MALCSGGTCSVHSPTQSAHSCRQYKYGSLSSSLTRLHPHPFLLSNVSRTLPQHTIFQPLNPLFLLHSLIPILTSPSSLSFHSLRHTYIRQTSNAQSSHPLGRTLLRPGHACRLPDLDREQRQLRAQIPLRSRGLPLVLLPLQDPDRDHR